MTNYLKPPSKSEIPYSLSPHPKLASGAQGSQAEPVPPPKASLHRDQIGEVDEVSLGREIPLRRGCGLPPLETRARM